MTGSLNGVETPPHMVTKSKTRAPQSSSLARGNLRRGLLIPGRKSICSRSGHVLVTCPESYPRLSTETKAATATTKTETETTGTRVERRECRRQCIHRRHVSISAFISVSYSWSNDRFYCDLFFEITCLPNDRSRGLHGSLRKHYGDSGISNANYLLIALPVVRINRKLRISLGGFGTVKHMAALYSAAFALFVKLACEHNLINQPIVMLQ